MACGLAFFGEDHILYASDAPYDVEQGRRSVQGPIDAIESMGLPESTKQKIYEGNACGCCIFEKRRACGARRDPLLKRRVLWGVISTRTGAN